MAKKVVALNGGLHSRIVEGKIKMQIREQCKQVLVFFFLHQFQEIVGWTNCDY
jgi:hypothetical protein